ncbi:MAG TPA: YncE family protein [Ktedonobacteraceae bacterium]|nr:YncE family protein [Ktedonobacteraceae bacterium]
MVKIFDRNMYRCFALCVLIFALLLLAPPVAHADGGAPNLAYVSGTSKGISVIDISKQNVSKTINVAGDPHTIQLSLDGRFLYVTQPQLGRVSIIAAQTGDTVCSANVPGQPTLLALDNTTGIIYAAGNGASTVSEIDPTNCTIKRTFQVSGPVYGLAVATVASSSSGSGNQLWIAAGPALTVLDDNSGQQISSVSISGSPRYITIPQGATVYVTTQQGSVVAIDLSSHKVVPLISGSEYGPMDYDANTGEVYVPDLKNNRLDVLAPVNAGFAPPTEPSRTVSLGVRPESVAITSDGQLGFVALDGGNVAMLDITGRTIINTFNVGGNPHFIITGLYPPVVGTTPQQANTLGTIFNIAAYILVIALFLVPILLFRKYARARSAAGAGTQAAEGDGPSKESEAGVHSTGESERKE